MTAAGSCECEAFENQMTAAGSSECEAFENQMTAAGSCDAVATFEHRPTIIIKLLVQKMARGGKLRVFYS